MRRILITGASGFVGRHALDVFRQTFGHSEILGIGRRSVSAIPNGVAYQTLDLNDPTTVTQIVSDFRPTTVLHLAAQASVAQADQSRFEAWRINLGGLYHLIDALDRLGTDCTLIFASSGEVYGRAFLRSLPATEDISPEPIGTYARSKHLGERLLIDGLADTCVRVQILRPFNHIGPGQSTNFAIASFANQIARIEAGLCQPTVEVGNLSTRRDFLDVLDVVEAYVQVVRNADAIPAGSVFNVSSGQARTIESALAEFQTLTDRTFEVHVREDRARPSEIPIAFGNAEHLRRTIGWHQTIDWPTSLRRVLDDARQRLAVARH